MENLALRGTEHICGPPQRERQQAGMVICKRRSSQCGGWRGGSLSHAVRRSSKTDKHHDLSSSGLVQCLALRDGHCGMAAVQFCHMSRSVLGVRNCHPSTKSAGR